MSVEVITSTTVADTFVTTATGATREQAAVKYFALQVVATGGTPTVWDVILEGSLDGTTFTLIVEHKNGVQTLGLTIAPTVIIPYTFYRTRCTGLTLNGATNIVAIVVGVQ